MPLRRLPAPFSDSEWLFELKLDGFRALAHIDDGSCQLVSRNGNRFSSFKSLEDELGGAAIASRCVIDGELVCCDAEGRPQFNQLLYRRAEPCFFAFDVLMLDGRDLRDLPLIQRKKILCRLLRGNKCHRLVYVDHVVAEGEWLFEQACALDVEGIVAKHRDGRYVAEREVSTWVKVRNPNYSQVVGRDEQFERLERPHEPEQAGWACCDAACTGNGR